jgi:Phosphopantothenate-cysteine ligase (EC 6.3.2.5)/Phosphopantothenoylcysteine decarboxylase (EC 4.1.1.36)
MDNSRPPHRILLGVSGGIAAYKAAELARLLVQAGCEVQVVMTAGAAHFVGAATFQAVTGRPVRDSLWDAQAEAAMGHIELARWADALLIAPASADLLARLAAGLADDLLTTLCLASDRPLTVVPAMNRLMWAHPATRANLATLRARGVRVLGPDSGAQACGETGPGRMVEPQAIAAALLATGSGPLAGRRAVVTAGPTREALDPVRYLSNRSSGKQGYAVAAALAALGAEVTLISGPVALDAPAGVQRRWVESAEQMCAATLDACREADLLVGTAAVADYRPTTPATQKIKKSEATLTVNLTRNPDILAAARAARPTLFIAGFAAETERVAEQARAKLAAKQLDLIAANPVGDGQGFDRDDNRLQVFWNGGERDLGAGDKRALAGELAALMAERWLATRSAV